MPVFHLCVTKTRCIEDRNHKLKQRFGLKVQAFFLVFRMFNNISNAHSAILLRHCIAMQCNAGQNCKTNCHSLLCHLSLAKIKNQVFSLLNNFLFDLGAGNILLYELARVKSEHCSFPRRGWLVTSDCTSDYTQGYHHIYQQVYSRVP